MNTLIDVDGENLAVRNFLILYGGQKAITIGQMKAHFKLSGYNKFWPESVNLMNDEDHLNKFCAGEWIRYLFNLEKQNDKN